MGVSRTGAAVAAVEITTTARATRQNLPSEREKAHGKTVGLFVRDRERPARHNRHSIFAITLDRKHTLNWLFHQEKSILECTQEFCVYSENALVAAGLVASGRVVAFAGDDGQIGLVGLERDLVKITIGLDLVGSVGEQILLAERPGDEAVDVV